MTAVEWLRSKMLIECLEPSDELFEQAKEMEKQQIIEAFEDGYISGYRDNGKMGSEYYNETFKK